MGRKPKSPQVRATFFRARASGATLRQAAAAAGVSRTAGHYWLAQSGGVRPRQPRPRPALRLSLEEREANSRGLAAGWSLTAIAASLGRSTSTVSREVARNSGVNGYRAARADRLATIRTARHRSGKLAADPVLRRYVEDKLGLCWSPAQISRRLVMEFPHDTAMRVSHETVYTSLFVQAKGVLRPELTGQLRTRRVRRRPHRRVAVDGRRSRIPDLVPISLRPASAADRREPGHWEGDLLVGRYGRSHLITLVERHSRYLMVLPIPDASSATVITALCRAFQALPATMAKTLTWDRGPEMTDTGSSACTPRSRCSSVTPTAPGNAAAMRTPTGCYASTSRIRPTCPCTRSTTSKSSPTSSTVAPARHCEAILLTRSATPPSLR